jgi:hypothetical protein
MSIDSKEFLPYINGTLDGMVQIVEALGDERVNVCPNNMPNTNSPFAILTHRVGLTRYFVGTALAGRQVHRDRDAEFRARGTAAEIRQAVHELQQHLSDDLARVHWSGRPWSKAPLYSASWHPKGACLTELMSSAGHDASSS